MSFPEREQTSIFIPGQQPQPQPFAAAPPPAPTHRAGRRRPPVWILAAVGALVLLGGGIGIYLVAFAPITVRGSVTLPAAGAGYGTGDCHGTGKFADIAAGTPVDITDGAGKTIALGHLDPGKIVNGSDCLFTFSVDAPRADIYGIEIGHRGVVKASRAEAQAGVALGIG